MTIGMRVILHTSPLPRLLTSVAPDRSLDQADLSSSSKETSIFSGNGRAISGIVLIVLALLLVPFTYIRYQASKDPAELAPGLIAVEIANESTVPISANMVHVTAISLGNPSLAIVNGKRVAEGDLVSLHTSWPAVIVKLRVLKIADGQIDLTDGTQVLTAHLEAQALKNPTRP
jgi:hypothetical protein